MMTKQQILVVDDEPDIRSLVEEVLKEDGFEVVTAKDAQQAKQLCTLTHPDLILLDIWMPGIDGITLLKEWKQQHRIDSVVIMMSGHGNIETAVEATRQGAYDFIEKPLSISKLSLIIKHALEQSTYSTEQHDHRKIENFLTLASKSPRIKELYNKIDRISHYNMPVLFIGEIGTEPECYARHLHHLNLNQDKDTHFVYLSHEMLNHLLAKQAQSQNNHVIQDYFSAGNTIYIEAIEQMDIILQNKLYDILKRHDMSNDQISFRLITSANQQITEFVNRGKFRADLYQMLDTFTIKLPALHEYREDIPQLLDNYVNYFIENEQLPNRRFSVAAQNRLRHYTWPGNITELKNLIRQFLLCCERDIIDIDEVEEVLSTKTESNITDHQLNLDLPLREARDDFERYYFGYQLKKYGNNISKIARVTGIERTHIYRKLKSLGIELR